MKSRTLADFIENYGCAVSSHLKETAENILEKHGFDSDTALPDTETVLPESITAPKIFASEQEKTTWKEELDTNTAEINMQREEEEQIKHQELLNDIEHSEERCCYISIDDIGVKHQKDKRQDGGSKTGRYVENTVVHIQADKKSYYLTAIGMRNAFAILLAFLLENHLLENRHLVFFADGARDIRNHIEEYFSFCHYTVILDWYHLKKKCKEYISSSVKGKKEQKNDIIQKLLRMLWVGNVEESILYLEGLAPELVKSTYWMEQLTGYLKRKKPQVACYALRAALGLRNSSNRVEKANDMLVAQRQKHNGMSWSFQGSGALAAITMILLNGESEQWMHTHTLSFAMRESLTA